MKTYKAIIWKPGSQEPGQRVRVTAESTEEARRLLEAEHGQECVFDLHNDEDASRPR